LALLLVAVFAAYSNSFDGAFHFDDVHTVVDNPSIRSLRNIPRFFTDATSFSVLPQNRTYRPVVSTMLAVDYALSRAAGRPYEPFWFHLITFLLFCCEVVLLYGLFRLVLDKTLPSPANPWVALFAAAWYGLHPAMAETVNYVIQRGDLYCTLGCVAALYLYARYPGLRRKGLYLVPFALAMLSKPPAAVFPVLLILYVYFFENRDLGDLARLRRAVAASLPSVGATVALMVLQSAMTPKSFVGSNLSASHYRLTQPFVWSRYVGELFLPLHLNADTDLIPFAELNLRALFGIVFVLGLLAAAAYTLSSRRLFPIAFGILWFVVTELPTSLYPLAEAENDHRMFFSFPGLMLAAAWGAWLLLLHFFGEAQQGKDPKARTVPSWVRWAAAVASVLVLFGYAYGVRQRNIVWHDDESLWRDDVEKSPLNGRGLMNYGLVQMQKGSYQAALDLFNRALERTPNYSTLEINLGIANGTMADAGEPSRAVDAERHFKRAIKLSPKYDGTHAYYGRWLFEHNRNPEAIEELTTAMQLNPGRLLQREYLIKAEEKAGDYVAVRQVAQDTLAIAPENGVAQKALRDIPKKDASYWSNLSVEQFKKGQYVQCIESARMALNVNPALAQAYNTIGAACAALHRWDDAIRSEEKALVLQPDYETARKNLAFLIAQKDRPQTAGAAPAGLPAK